MAGRCFINIRVTVLTHVGVTILIESVAHYYISECNVSADINLNLFVTDSIYKLLNMASLDWSEIPYHTVPIHFQE